MQHEGSGSTSGSPKERDLLPPGCVSESCAAPPALLCQEKATEPLQREVGSSPGHALAFPAHRSACGRLGWTSCSNKDRFRCTPKGGEESVCLYGGGHGDSSALSALLGKN